MAALPQVDNTSSDTVRPLHPPPDHPDQDGVEGVGGGDTEDRVRSDREDHLSGNMIIQSEE